MCSDETRSNICADEPQIINVNFEVFPNGDINIAIPNGCKPVDFIRIPENTKLFASTNANIRFQCHCADGQLHMYVRHYGSWIDLGHVGPCSCS